MLVKLKYFGIPTAGIEKTGSSAEIPAGSTVEDLLSAVWGKTERFKSASFLVNHTQASLKTTLDENDEVMILRPLNGG